MNQVLEPLTSWGIIAARYYEGTKIGRKPLNQRDMDRLREATSEEIRLHAPRETGRVIGVPSDDHSNALLSRTGYYIVPGYGFSAIYGAVKPEELREF